MTKDNDKEINEQDLDNVSGGSKVDIKKFINVGVTIELDDAQLKAVTGGRGVQGVEKDQRLIEKEKEETPAVETETTDSNPHDDLLPKQKPAKYGPR